MTSRLPWRHREATYGHLHLHGFLLDVFNGLVRCHRKPDSPTLRYPCIEFPRISGIPDGFPSRNLAPPVLNFFNEFRRFDQRFAFHPCLKPPNVDLPTAAGDLVNNLGLLLCWQCVLNFGHGPEGSPGFEDHPQAKLPADSPV